MSPTIDGSFQESLLKSSIYRTSSSRDGNLRASPRDQRPTQLHRELKSDFLLVPAPGADGLVEFRDVFEVDGKPVRDREDRLTRLFLQRSPIDRRSDSNHRVESARYNIGSVYRDMNTPTLPLLFLDVRYQSRFKFKRFERHRAAARTRLDQVSTLYAAAGTVGRRVPGNRERTPSFSEHRSVATCGSRAILDRPATGRVLMSEVIVSDPVMRATIDVAYQNAPDIDLLIPIEMRERYENNRDQDGDDWYRDLQPDSAFRRPGERRHRPGEAVKPYR